MSRCGSLRRRAGKGSYPTVADQDRTFRSRPLSFVQSV